ncbi:ERF family protein [Roseibium sp.]|uniref:ERF family protein n=1 Tax=Roseibium sp. TaxID=1936156 RepID=UPI003B52A72D
MTAVKRIEQQSPQAVAPVSQNEALLRMIQEAATNPDIDLDRMERLFEMRERIVAKEAETSFFASMKAAQAEMPQVVRDAKNDQTRSRYAKYETISRAIQPVIAKHGFALTFSEADSDKPNCIRVVCEVMHEFGHSKTYTADIPFDNVGMKGTANKTNTHAYGSTKQYGRRYLKCDIFDIAVTDQDHDGNQPTGTVSNEQIEALEKELTGMDVHRFLQFMRVEQIRDIPANQFKRAINAIKQERANNGR